jgi:hypothetical protein
VTSVEQPAFEDDVTARLFEFSVERLRGTAFAPWLLLMTVGVSAFLWDVAPVVAVVMAAVGLVGMWQAFRHAMPASMRWVAAARRLLSDEPWRETPATVLDTRGTVLVLPAGEHVRVYGLPAPAREVAVRAGRVWVVGPDAAGWLAVRVGGLHTPWPARRVASRNAAQARPTTEPIVTAWGRHLVGRARSDLWLTVVGAVVVSGVAVLAGVPWLIAVAAVCGAGCIAYTARAVRRATRVRDAGPWRRADATVPSWDSRRNGCGDGSIALRFPDGHRFTAHLENVPLDLFANAWREEALWVAGDVVGFPDYPVAAFARITPVTEVLSSADRRDEPGWPVGGVSPLERPGQGEDLSVGPAFGEERDPYW